MSPEQFKVLQKLRQLFEEGRANPNHIKQLSELLSLINQQKPENNDLTAEVLEQMKDKY